MPHMISRPVRDERSLFWLIHQTAIAGLSHGHQGAFSPDRSRLEALEAPK